MEALGLEESERYRWTTPDTRHEQITNDQPQHPHSRTLNF